MTGSERRSVRARLALALLSVTVCGTPPALASYRLICSQVPAGRLPAPGTVAESDVEAIPTGSRVVLTDAVAGDHAVEVLTDGFSAAWLADLSPDANRALLVGRRTDDDRNAVWEIDLASRETRRVTDCDGGCAQAVYAGALFDIRSNETAEQIVFRDRGGAMGGSALHSCRLDGTARQRITFHPGRVRDPSVLGDGRLVAVFDDSVAAGTGLVHGDTLMTLNIDGTDLFPFVAATGATAHRSAPCETADGSVVFAESDGPAVSRLVAVSRARGAAGGRRVLAESPTGEFRAPGPGPEGGVLVSYRPAAGGTFGIYRVAATPDEPLAAVFDDTAWHEVNAAPLAPRPPRPGRSTVVDARASRGLLYGLNAYLSDPHDGDAAESVRIAALRVIHGQSGAGGAIREQTLGVAPVETDGSFFLDVPARTPLRLETLDRDGRVIRGMRSFFWVMPGERRGCIGCHEDRLLTPPNRHVRALRRRPDRIAAPIDATTTSSQREPNR